MAVNKQVWAHPATQTDAKVGGEVDTDEPLASPEGQAVMDQFAAFDDERVLSEMGYKQDLLRGFEGWLTNFCFCFTAVSIMPSIATTFSTAVPLGGPEEMVYSWIIASFFTIITGFAMAEICSVYPSAGSVYHWAGILAAPRWAPLSSYVCGWFNLLGNAAGDASFAWGFASLVSSAAPTPISTGGQVGIAIAVCALWAVLNVLRIDQQGWMNQFSAVWQIGSVLAISIALFSMGSSAGQLAPAAFVWQTFYNGSGWSGVNGYVALVGMIGALFSFSGYEAGAHLAEETKGARRSAPIGVVLTCIVGAIFGFLYLLSMLYSMPDVTQSMSSSSVSSSSAPWTPTEIDATNYALSGYAPMYLYTRIAGIAGGRGLIALTIIAIFFAGVSSLTVTTRIMFAMARDGALPGSAPLRWIWPATKSPVVTVLITFIFDAVIMLLPLGSSSALFAITGVSAVCYQISYAIPLILRVTVSLRTFRQGEFHLGPFSVACHVVAALWLTITSLFFFWPPSGPAPVSVKAMNWTVVIIAGFAVLAATYWIFWSRHTFRGPHQRAQVEAERAAAAAAAVAVAVDGALGVASSPSAAAALESPSSTPSVAGKTLQAAAEGAGEVQLTLVEAEWREEGQQGGQAAANDLSVSVASPTATEAPLLPAAAPLSSPSGATVTSPTIEL